MAGKTRIVIGLIEDVTFANGKTYKAKIDTGADSSSIDEKILTSLGDVKFSDKKSVRSALGKSVRKTVFLEVDFHGIKFNERFTVSDRSQLRYKVLIGKDILKKEGFLIDPSQ